MKKIYFCRHGETFWNVENKICGATDIALTPKGHAQAEETGRLIKERLEKGEIVIDEILSSPLSRAYDTAKHIAELTGLPLRAEERLREHRTSGSTRELLVTAKSSNLRSAILFSPMRAGNQCCVFASVSTIF